MASADETPKAPPLLLCTVAVEGMFGRPNNGRRYSGTGDECEGEEAVGVLLFVIAKEASACGAFVAAEAAAASFAPRRSICCRAKGDEALPKPIPIIPNGDDVSSPRLPRGADGDECWLAVGMLIALAPLPLPSVVLPFSALVLSGRRGTERPPRRTMLLPASAFKKRYGEAEEKEVGGADAASEEEGGAEAEEKAG